MLKEVDEYQADLLDKIINFMKKTKSKSLEKKQIKKALLLKTCIIFLKIEKKFFMLAGILDLAHFRSCSFAQVKAGNNSESFLNEIRQIAYSLYQSKEITNPIIKNEYNIYELRKQ